MDERLTVEDVAAWLKVHPQSVRRWLRAGELAGSNLGGSAGWRVEPAAVRSFLQERHGKPTLRKRPENAGLSAGPPLLD